MSIRVLLVDDHAVLRDGLRLVLEAQPDMQVVGDAADGRRALAMIDEQRPDVVLMDISMADLNGIEATAQANARHPAVRVIILSMLATRDHIYAALQSGASGYLLKESLGREVVDAIRKVAAGHRFLGQGVADILAEDAAKVGETPFADSPFEILSSREMEVFQLLVEGHAPKEIADTLGLSPKTVDTYRARLMTKLGVDNLAALVKLAIRHGITPLGS